MKYPDKLSHEDAARISDFNDARERPRFALLLRSAKLVAPGCEFLCIIRDISETGAKLRLFHELPTYENLALEISSGERFPIEHVWVENGEAGFRFVEPIDVMRFIAEAGPYPKRPVRIRVRHEATLVSGGVETQAELQDLSREGARIEASAKLAIGQKLRILSDELPELEATVCWRRHPAYGLVFRQVMSMEALALHSLCMQPDEDYPDDTGTTAG